MTEMDPPATGITEGDALSGSANDMGLTWKPEVGWFQPGLRG